MRHGKLLQLGLVGLMLLALVVFSPTQKVAAADCTFNNGAADGKWETDANWSCGHAPANSDAATIPNGLTVSLGTGTENAWWAGGLTIESSGTLLLQRGVKVTGATFAVNGTLQINSGGYVDGTGTRPTYGDGSTLKYNSNYGLTTNEWDQNVSSGTAVPYHVEITSGAAVTFNGSAYYRTVRGNFTNNGTFTLGNVGGDLRVAGNFTNNGTFNCNGRQVVFNGSGTQTLTGATTFDYLDIANTSDGNVTLASDITLLRELKISSGGTLNADATTITLRGSTTAGVDFVNNDTFNHGTGTVAFEGNTNKNGRVLGNSATTFNNVTLTSLEGTTRPFGVDFFDQDGTPTRATIAGTLTLNQYTFIAEEELGKSSGGGTDGAPLYGTNSTLLYNNSGSFNSAAEWKTSTTCGDPAVPYNVIIANNTTVNLNAEYQRIGDSTQVYPAGSTKATCGTVTINNGSTLQSTSGTFYLRGNWVNDGTFTHNAGTFTFNSLSGSQTMGGTSATTFANLHINNNQYGVTLLQNQTVENALTLTSGRLLLRNYQLTLANSASVGGTPAAANMVVTDGSGALCKNYGGTGSFTFPIGETTETAEYSPATLNFTSGTFDSGQACVRVTDAAHPGYTTLPAAYITRYWTVTASGITAFTANAAFTYLDADVVGTETTMTARKVDGTTWLAGPAVNDGANTFAMDVTGFSGFTAGSSNPTAVFLSSFTALPEGEGIRVAWETAAELDNLGFNLYRSESPAGPWVKLNAELIGAQNPGGMFGASYEWLDTGVTSGATVYYRLEDVDVNGASTFHGPVSATASGVTAVRVTAFGAHGTAPAVLLLTLATVAVLALERRRRRAG